MTLDSQTYEFILGATTGALLAASVFSSELRGAFVAIVAAIIGGLVATAYADNHVAEKLLAASAKFTFPDPLHHLMFIAGAVIGAVFVVLVHIRK